MPDRIQGMTDHAANRELAVRPTVDLAAWRRARLLQAGFAEEIAAELALEPTVDFHALLELIDRGCPPHLAARIMAPLDSERSPWGP